MRHTQTPPARALILGSLLLAFAAAPAFAKMDVELWTDRGDDAVYQPGDDMHIKVRTTGDSYLLVYELDTQGNVNLLYPLKRGSGYVEGKKTFRLPEDITEDQLVVEKETGQGFIVAIASEQPFNDLPWYLRPFDPQAASVGYAEDPEAKAKDEEGFDENGRAVGDPYVVMERIRRRVLTSPENLEVFGTAYTTYYVHEQVSYPRYVCNDCHRPGSWSWWPGFDPYYTHCSVVDFRVNWSWAWGPRIWTTYVPYYYYVVRPDCPPFYRQWAVSTCRFSAWDGFGRWNTLWGGELRRYKAPLTAPATYAPPPTPGTRWRGEGTPPGFVPPDVRRRAGTPGERPITWLQRDRGDGRPVWRAPGTSVDPATGRLRPINGGVTMPRISPDLGGGRRVWRMPAPGTDTPVPANSPAPGERSRPIWRNGGGGSGGGNDQPRQQPAQRPDPPRGEPVYRQPPPPSAPPQSAPRQQGRPEFRGASARGGGSSRGK